MSLRERIADCIRDGLEQGADIEEMPDFILFELKDAGWRPPARTIETVEEMDALPEGSIIRDGYGDAWHKDGGWSCTDTTFAYLSKTIVNVYGPVAVLWTPEEQR